MSNLITMSSRRSGKAAALKDDWITQTQEHQREMREDGDCDSYEELSDQYVRQFCKVKDSDRELRNQLNRRVALD